MTQIGATIICGVLTLIGVCITAWASAKATRSAVSQQLLTAQAVTDQKIVELTREVREHNNFARRVPVVESQIEDLQRRCDALESK